MAETRNLPELTEVRAAHRLDLDVLANYFTSQLPQFGGALTVRQFKDGQSNPTFLLNAEARQVVLRKKPPGDLLPGAHRIEREFRIISALAEHDVPVPGALHLCEDESIIGTPVLCDGICRGRGLPRPGAARHDGGRARRDLRFDGGSVGAITRHRLASGGAWRLRQA